MYKRIIVTILLLLLSSCSNHKQTSCILEKDNKYIDLDIKAINDDILSIKQRVVFTLPNNLMANEEWLSLLENQLDSSYYFEENKLVSESIIELDKTYSFEKTIEYLRKEKYFCE